jgi:hypothetical protein
VDFQLGVFLQSLAVQLCSPEGGNVEEWSFRPEAAPEEGVSPCVVHLVHQKLHVELFEAGEGEELFLLGGFEVRIGEALQDLFLECLSVD